MDNFIDMQNATQELSFWNNGNRVLIQFDCIIYFYYLSTVFHQEFSISKDNYIFHISIIISFHILIQKYAE